MKKFFLIIIISFAFILPGCYVNQSKEEKAFKLACKDLKSLLESLQSRYKTSRKKVYPKGDDNFKFFVDVSAGAEYIQKTKKEWENVSLIFDNILVKYPDSIWADDALFCLGLEYLNLAVVSKDEYYTKKAINEMERYVKRNESSKIEDWTKKMLHEVFWKSCEYMFSKEAPEKQNIDSFFLYGIGSMFELNKDYQNAIVYFNKARELNPESGVGKLAEGRISNLEIKNK